MYNNYSNFYSTSQLMLTFFPPHSITSTILLSFICMNSSLSFYCLLSTDQFILKNRYLAFSFQRWKERHFSSINVNSFISLHFLFYFTWLHIRHLLTLFIYYLTLFFLDIFLFFSPFTSLGLTFFSFPLFFPFFCLIFFSFPGKETARWGESSLVESVLLTEFDFYSNVFQKIH